MNQASLVLILAFVLGALLPFAVRPLLHALNMVDIPNERSSHTTPTYRGMGLATASATCLSFAVATLMGWTVNLPIWLTFLAGGGLALLLGWTEDVYGVSIAKRAGMQLVIGLGIALSLAIIQEASLLWVPVAGLFIAGYINVTNFMDGINGISGCHGLVAGLAYAYMGGVSSLPWMTIGGLAIAGAYTAFLPWNLRTGHNVFLGDAGSYFLGASLGTIAVGAFYAGIPFLASIAPLLVYLADSAMTLIRRMAAGEQWYKPHRTHVYQRLTDVGLGHISATIMVSSATAIVWAFVLFASDLFLTGAFFAGVGVLALAVAVIVLYLRLPELLDTRLQPAEQGHANSKQNIADLNTETHPMSERKSEGSQE